MEENKLKKIKGIYFIIAMIFAIPSIVYFMKNRTLLNFDGDLEFCFLLTNNISRLHQAIIYTLIIITLFVIYYLIIKNRKILFKTTKQVYSFIFIISVIFVFVVPFWCSDIFYYLGIGRLASKYNQNPYYTDIKSYVDDNNIDISKDTLMQKGYKNYWSNTTVVYGAFWTFICSVISFLSFGNLDFGMLIFKIVNLFIHIGNCYLLFKISKKKIFPLLYGLNPFILIEGISNVHNDMFVIFFMLLSLFMLLKKRKIIFAILFLALATCIKYFSILLLPLIVIFYYRDKNIKTRFIKCIEAGILFIVFLGIPYLLYIRDFNVFLGIAEQRNRIAKGLYLIISMFLCDKYDMVYIIKNISLLSFSLIYIIDCINLLFSKKVIFYKKMRELFIYILVFLFLLITNFQPWYFMWLVPFMIWQKSKNIKLIIEIQLMTLIANIVFLIYSESYIYGIHFFTVFVFGILLCNIINKKYLIGKEKNERINKKRNK